MAEPIQAPNLPEREVRLAAVGEGYANQLYAALNRLHISIFPVPENPNVDKRLAFHADLSLFHAGGNVLIAAKTAPANKCADLKKEGFLIHAAALYQASDYPHDCTLNACRIGRCLIVNPDTVDPVILAHSPDHVEPISVRQGYTKCAVCVVDENHLITADPGIAKAARTKRLDVLEIQSGYIELAGFDTGFIGGCCGKLSKDCIAFTGHLNRHPDKSRILEYIHGLGMRVEYLTDKPIFDVGSILPLKEA